MDKRVYLKVKLKSLAAEAKIIRLEEKKNSHFRVGLAEHRRGIVRFEARHTLLAYGFLRGRSYEQLEPGAREKNNHPTWDRVREMVKKYGLVWDHENESYKDYQERRKEQLKAFEQWILSVTSEKSESPTLT